MSASSELSPMVLTNHMKTLTGSIKVEGHVPHQEISEEFSFAFNQELMCFPSFCHNSSSTQRNVGQSM